MPFLSVAGTEIEVGEDDGVRLAIFFLEAETFFELPDVERASLFTCQLGGHGPQCRGWEAAVDVVAVDALVCLTSVEAESEGLYARGDVGVAGFDD